MFNRKQGNINPCITKLIKCPLAFQGQELCSFISKKPPSVRGKAPRVKYFSIVQW